MRWTVAQLAVLLFHVTELAIVRGAAAPAGTPTAQPTATPTTAVAPTEEPHLAIPPDLQGYHGLRYINSQTGGIVEVELNRFLKRQQYYNSRGTWYNIVECLVANISKFDCRAARTNNCDNHPESVACMACSQNMPPFTTEAGVVPIAVGAELFAFPEKGATCSMCLRIYMPQDYPSCADHVTNASCAGAGSHPYVTNVNQTWAWNATIKMDDLGYYVTALVIEWFDRAAELPYQLTYPTQGVGPTALFGDWPIKYKAVPCPVGNNSMLMSFLDFSKEVPVTGICNNQFGQPCGAQQILFPGEPLGYMKLQVTQQQTPVARVEVFLKNGWTRLLRSGDGFFEPGHMQNYTAPALDGQLRVRVYCANGQAAQEVSVVPGQMLCSYQNPTCLGKEVPGLQCSADEPQ